MVSEDCGVDGRLMPGGIYTIPDDTTEVGDVSSDPYVLTSSIGKPRSIAPENAVFDKVFKSSIV